MDASTPQTAQRALVRTTLIIASLIIASSLTACGSFDDDSERVRRRDALQNLAAADVDAKAAVVTVNGRPIPLSSVRQRVARERGGRSKQDIIDELILAELLAQDAIDKGYGDSDAVTLLHKKYMVQKFLEREFEARNRIEDFPMKEIRAYYDDNRHLYFTPELRTVDHLLIMFDDDLYNVRENPDAVPEALKKSAHALSAQIRADLVASGIEKPDGVALQILAEAWRKKGIPKGLELRVERNLTSPRRQSGAPGQPGFIPSMVEPFAKAMFELEPHQISDPVDTVFGTHILVVLDVTPEVSIPFEEAEPGIRKFLFEIQRREAFRVFFEKLTVDAQVQLDPEAARRLEASEKEEERGGEP